MYPVEGWTPGALLANYREIKFGTYLFPLSFQEEARNLKLKADQRPLPFGYGEYIDPNSSVMGRDITIKGDMGTGLQGGFSNTTLVTATDLETERAVVAALQNAGRQKLWVRPDRYCWAYLIDNTHAFFQDGGGFRFATWTLKFRADDPRYYSTNPTVLPFTTTTGPFQQQGTVRAYPTITIPGPVTNPTITMIDGASGNSLSVTFTVVLGASDVLVIRTDPRPEARRFAALLTSAGSTVNALQYITVPTGFANNLDASEIFPFINPAGNNTTITCTAGGNYSVSYYDTWL